jgi:hypothetical protein
MHMVRAAVGYAGFLLLAGAAVAACDDDNPAGAGTPDGGGATSSGGTSGAGTSSSSGGTSSGGTSGDVPKDAGVEAGNTGDSGATDSGALEIPDGGTCTGLVLSPPVVPTYATEAAPAPAGGDPIDGIYHITRLVHYGSATAGMGNDPLRVAVKISGNTLAWVTKNKDEPEKRASFTFTKAGTQLQLTNVCPTPGPGGTPGYTATTEGGKTIFKLYLDAEYVVTKQ